MATLRVCAIAGKLITAAKMPDADRTEALVNLFFIMFSALELM